MFYSRDILQKRGGKFAIVWLAATNTSKISKREYHTVNVIRTCDDIIDYIMLRAPARVVGGAHPRLSLYLSAQLMFGTVKVFSQLQDYFLTDVNNFYTRCRLTFPVAATSLDLLSMIPLDKADLVTLPNHLDIACRYAPAFDPGFGHFYMDIEVASDRSAPGSPESRVGAISPPQQLPQDGASSPAHTVASSEITMQEDTQLHSIRLSEMPLYAGEDLLLLDGQDLAILEEDQAMLTEPVDAILRQSQLLLIPDHTHLESTPLQHMFIHDEQFGSTLRPEEKTPLANISETHLQGEPGRHGKRRPRSPEVTPIPADAGAASAHEDEEQHMSPRRRQKLSNLSMDLTPVTPSPVVRRRRRRLLFADHTTQIRRRVMRENIRSSADTCMPLILPSTKLTVADMMSRPAGMNAFKRKELLQLWTRHAYVSDFKETDSDKERPIWTVPGLSGDHSSSSESGESRVLSMPLSPEHVVIDQTSVVEPMDVVTLEASALSERIEAARFETSSVGSIGADLSSAILADQQSIHDEVCIDDIPLINVSDLHQKSSDDELIDVPIDVALDDQHSVLPVLLEEAEYIDNGWITSPIRTSSQDLLRKISEETTLEAWTTFQTICPTSNTRREATRKFTLLLGLLAKQAVQVRQEQAYEDIYIRPS